MSLDNQKIEVMVRFANEGLYYNTISINPKNIKDPMIFPSETFFTIDGIRVAVRNDDWKKIEEWNETGEKN